MRTPRAFQIMTQKVVTLAPQTNIYKAMQVLLDKGFSGAPVVDEEGSLIGILSEKDCLKVMTGEAFDGLPEGKVCDYMTKPVATVKPDTTIYDVVGRFLEKPYRRLPVIDRDGHLVGQISRRDVLRAIVAMSDNPYLYGHEDGPPVELDDNIGVHTAMRIARNL